MRGERPRSTAGRPEPAPFRPCRADVRGRLARLRDEGEAGRPGPGRGEGLASRRARPLARDAALPGRGRRGARARALGRVADRRGSRARPRAVPPRPGHGVVHRGPGAAASRHRARRPGRRRAGGNPAAGAALGAGRASVQRALDPGPGQRASPRRARRRAPWPGSRSTRPSPSTTSTWSARRPPRRAISMQPWPTRTSARGRDRIPTSDPPDRLSWRATDRSGSGAPGASPRPAHARGTTRCSR